MTWVSAPAPEMTHQRISQLAILINGFPFDSADFSNEADVPLVRIRDLSAPDFETFVPREKVPAFSIVRDGDVVIGMDGDFNSVLWHRGEAALNQRVCLLRAKPGVDPRYISYAIPPHLKEINDLTWSTTVKHLSAGSVRAIRIPAQSVAQQRAIADYLDRETAQIDAFIAKNEELIALLTERRAAVIGRAVTRGLSEVAPLSSDGPEWIGQVPAAWSVRPIKAEYTVVVGKMLNESKSEGDLVPYVRAANIQPHGLDLSDIKEMKATVPERTSLALRAGDVVFVEGGGGYGRSDFLTEDLAGWVFQNHVIRLRPRRGHDGRFLNYWLQHVRMIGHYEALSAFATIPNVSGDKLGRIEMPVPPLEEQRRLVEYIDGATKRIDDAINVARRGVEFAKERRAALISAAVTGKIDVRGAA